MKIAKSALGFIGRTVLVAALLYGFGFLLFVLTLPSPAAKPVHADAIVALTGGGEARLDAAVQLLEAGAAKRLLITGVHPSITKPEIKEITHGGAKFHCCADLDFAAEDTRENAADAAQWMRKHAFKSLILVTANYHMPRSMGEFSAEMPKIRIVPYPVEPDRVDFSHWWRNPHTLRLLHAEYVKYLASLALDRLLPAPNPPPKQRGDRD